MWCRGYAAPSEQVTGSDAEQQQPAEREGVRVDHPFQAAAGESGCGLNVRQCDVDGGRVKHDHRLGGRDDRQCRAEVAAVVRGACALIAGDVIVMPPMLAAGRRAVVVCGK